MTDVRSLDLTFNSERVRLMRMMGRKMRFMMRRVIGFMMRLMRFWIVRIGIMMIGFMMR